MSRGPWIAGLLLVASLGATDSSAGPGGLDGARRLVVTVVGENADGDEVAFGAGVAFAIRGPMVYLATADHVVRQRRGQPATLKVGFREIPERMFPADLVETLAPRLDLAFLRLDLTGSRVPASVLPDPATDGRWTAARDLDRGHPVYPVGHPQGSNWFVPSQPARLHEVGAIEIGFEFPCGTGHSGGALFDDAWRLIGLIIKKSNDFVCTALDFQAVEAELRKRRYPLDLEHEAAVRDVSSRLGPSQGTGPRITTQPFSNRAGSAIPDLANRSAAAVRDALSGLAGVELVAGGKAAYRLGGTVTSYRVDRREFEGYGVKTVTDTYHLVVELELQDLETSSLLLSKALTAKAKAIYSNNSAPAQPADRSAQLLEKLTSEAARELEHALGR